MRKLPNNWPAIGGQLMQCSYPDVGDRDDDDWANGLEARLPKGWKLAHIYKSNDNEAFVATRHKYAIAVIRGTQPDQPIDLLRDLMSIIRVDGRAVGFQIATDHLENEGIIEDLAELHLLGYSVSVMGHSLGGAIATQLAGRIYQRTKTKVLLLMTAGSPRSLDPFNSGLQTGQIEYVARFVHYLDPVVLVPFRWSMYGVFGGFLHLGASQWFDATGVHRKNQGNLGYAIKFIWGCLLNGCRFHCFRDSFRCHSMTRAGPRGGYAELLTDKSANIIYNLRWPVDERR